MVKKVPLILDTDIGCDIDDSWALAMALKSSELDLRLIVTEEDDTIYKAKICAKMLEAAGRTDIPVGIGIKSSENNRHLAAWVEDYDLEAYPNLYTDGVQAIIDTIMASDEKITVLTIGPLKNIAAAIEREPRIAQKSKIVGIQGNIYNSAFPGWIRPLSSEWNIRCDLSAYRRAFENNDWEIDLIPLDISSNIYLPPELYSKVAAAAKDDPLIAALMECQEMWFKVLKYDFNGTSSALFDTVGVYAAFTHENLYFERLPIYANDESLTLIDPERGKMMNVGLRWGDKQKFYRFLAARLCGEI